MMMLTTSSAGSPRTGPWTGALVLLAACLLIAVIAWAVRLVVRATPDPGEDETTSTDAVELLGAIIAALH
jgi:hypothetical protein